MIKIGIKLYGEELYLDTDRQKIADDAAKILEKNAKDFETIYQLGYRSGMEDGQSLKPYSVIRRTYAWVGFIVIILAIAYLINN